MVIIGGLLVATMVFFPRGIVVMVAERLGRLIGRRAAPPHQP
jgi:ABC-type branched-subunit amino acid transport system permease subunit